jgi:hypothetical protein
MLDTWIRPALALIQARFQAGEALATVAPWIPAGLIAIYLKRALLQVGGYRIVARTIGRSEGQDLTRWERLALFRSDVVVNLVIVPVALVVVLGPLPRAARAAVVTLGSLAVALLLYAQIQATYKLGRFLSLELLRDARRWARDNAETASYLGRSGVVRIVGALAAIVAAGVWCAVAGCAAGTASPAARASEVAIPGVLFVSSVAWLPRVARTRYHENALVRAIQSLWDDAGADKAAVAGLAPDGVVALHRELARAPARRRDPRFFGRADGYDVLFFVLETGTARSIDLDGPLDDLPNLARLRERALVAPAHHTAYPYTNRAVYALLSGCYPNNDMKSVVQLARDFRAPGIMRSLAARGYETAVYNPSPNSFEEDDRLYAGLGVERQRCPEPAALPPEASDPAAPAWVRRRAKDEAALALLKADIARSAAEGRRFAHIFLPQVGHGPWPDFPGPSDPVGRGRALAAIQDRWLGEVLETLRAAGRLERTLIVFTADHGLRTREEDPEFEGGTIDACSFHVPLLVFAPGVLERPERVDWVTSHVDLAPTLLDLLGIEEGRALEQGTALWDERLAGRTTFLFANHFLGADGFHSRGRFHMWSHATDAVFVRDGRLRFGGRHLVPQGDPRRAETIALLRKAIAVQQVWGGLFGRCGGDQGAEAA